jgi:hypothetical protein
MISSLGTGAWPLPMGRIGSLLRELNIYATRFRHLLEADAQREVCAAGQRRAFAHSRGA